MVPVIAGLISAISAPATSLIQANQDKKAFSREQAERERNNQLIFDLERERLELMNSPEYKAEQNKKLYMAGGIFLVIAILAYIIIRK